MTVSDATTPEAAGLVDVRALVPDIDLDLRYAGRDNFVGDRIDGYEAPRCFLLRPAAEALQRAEQSLRHEGLRLRLYDCYRPARAVRHFVAWAHDLDDQRTKARHYPGLDKQQLLDGYISPTSGHSRGATVDLTLLRCDAAGGDCRPLDMGTGFDFFDPLANTDSPRATPEQRANRHRLRAAMQAAGFRNYPMEWWHFTLDPEPAPKTFFDVPVR
ncbi:MAG TPA: M15 family metallopeptidase [Lysobacter sp.]